MIKFVYDLDIVLEAIQNQDYKDAIGFKHIRLIAKKQLINLFINKKGFILQYHKKQKQ